VIVLQDADLVALVDEAHGGEVLDLVVRSTGFRPLGRPPFAPLAALAGDMDEDTWTDRYRGGWQVATPNAGNACTVAGDHHGFHGGASASPWQVIDGAAAHATLAWEGHGLRIVRRLALTDAALRADTAVTALAGPAPLIAVEHVTVGLQLLSPAVELHLPAGRAYELDETTGPTRPPESAPRFPLVLGLDGRVEEEGHAQIAHDHGRLYVVADVPDGRAEVVNAATGDAMVLEWDAAVLPHLWVWHETRATGGRWRNSAEIIGVEPSMTPHSLGLERALAEGQARIVRPGEPLAWHALVRPLAAS